jgi:hypothetical protein
MTRLQVTRCGECPMGRWSASAAAFFCTHPGMPNRTVLLHRDGSPLPEACPLRKGPTVVELAEEVQDGR